MRKFLQHFFYHLYHSFAWAYDFVAAIVSVGRWQAWVFAALPHLRGSRILEIGFGPGHLQVELQQRGFHAFGLDESWQMVWRARNKLRQKRLPSALLRGYAQFLPFATGSLDGVVATFPSEYIANQLTLAEIKRALQPSGRLIIIPMAWMWGKSLADRVAKWLFRVTGQAEGFPETFESQLNTLLTESGFRVEVSHTEIRHSTVAILIAEKHSQD